MPRVGAGALDRRITIQVRTDTSVDGQTLTSWTNLAEVAASLTPTGGTEMYVAGQRMANDIIRWRIRWREDIALSSKMHRIVFHGLTYDITNVNEVGRRAFWDVDGIARAQG